MAAYADVKKTAEPISNDSRDAADSSLNGSDPPLPEPEPESKGSGYQNGEHEFDTGLMAWLQVLGSHFLFFNSWYALRLFFFFSSP